MHTHYLAQTGERQIAELFPSAIEEAINDFTTAMKDEVKRTLDESWDDWKFLFAGYYKLERGELDDSSVEIQEISIDLAGKGKICVDWVETSYMGCPDKDGYEEHQTLLDFEYSAEKCTLKILGAVERARSTADEL